MIGFFFLGLDGWGIERVCSETSIFLQKNMESSDRQTACGRLPQTLDKQGFSRSRAREFPLAAP